MGCKIFIQGSKGLLKTFLMVYHTCGYNGYNILKYGINPEKSTNDSQMCVKWPLCWRPPVSLLTQHTLRPLPHLQYTREHDYCSRYQSCRPVGTGSTLQNQDISSNNKMRGDSGRHETSAGWTLQVDPNPNLLTSNPSLATDSIKHIAMQMLSLGL